MRDLDFIYLIKKEIDEKNERVVVLTRRRNKTYNDSQKKKILKEIDELLQQIAVYRNQLTVILNNHY